MLGILLEAKTPLIVVTPNIDHIVRCKKQKDLMKLYNTADYCLNDSRLLSLMANIFLGIKLPVLTGSDLTFEFFNKATINNKRLLLVGVDKWQVIKLKKKFNLNENVIIDSINPDMGYYKYNEKVENLTKIIENKNSDFIFLALGSPQQEILAKIIKPRLNKGVVFCIGASINYITGKEYRAPKVIQVLYLEWLFRFIQSPIKRFHRYFIDCPKIFYYLFKESKKRK
jgi:exopolysaccharide biosynthesis WecB/TagA/CpsF family protein